MKEKNVLSPKDCSYIEDCLEQTLVLHKRCTHEKELLETVSLCDLFEEVNATLAGAYNTLLDILEKEKA